MFASDSKRARIAYYVHVRALFARETVSAVATRMTEYNEGIPIHELDIVDLIKNELRGRAYVSDLDVVRLTDQGHYGANRFITDLVDAIVDTERGEDFLREAIRVEHEEIVAGHAAEADGVLERAAT